MSDKSSPDALKLCRETSDIDVVVDLTRHTSPQVRLKALREMCPCRVKTDIDDFWRRVFQMTGDPDEAVRQQVLHTICDGSPLHLEDEVAAALQRFNTDPSSKIRRTAHKALAAYRRTGKWNVL